VNDTPPAERHTERLQQVASASRDLLAHSAVARWEIFAKASSTREMEVAREAPVQIVHTEETGVAVRTVRNGQCGFAAASGLGAAASRTAVEGALGSEVASPIDPLPPPHLLGTTANDGLCQLPPQGWAAHVAEELAEAVRERSEGSVRLLRTVVHEGSYSWLLTTAEGFVASHTGSSSSMLAELMVDEEQSGIWREWIHVPDPERLAPAAVAAQMCNRLLLTRSRLGADSGLKDVLLHGEVVAHVLAAMAPLLVVTPARPDRLPGLVNRDGQLASPCLGLVDDRTDALAPVTGPCDGEGLTSRRTLLVEEGVPRHRLASYRDAVVCDEVPRGGAVRLSYRDYPASGLTALRVITDGGLTPTEILDRTDRALYLLRPLTSVSLDLEADSYRLVASGVWLINGVVQGWHPVVELSGRLGALLRRIDAVGTDGRWYQTGCGCVHAPSILVRRQPVVG
jgi:PmbA protein